MILLITTSSQILKKISIVIPCHNRRAALSLTLESLNKQVYPSEDFEVIVVDQDSSDGSRDLTHTLKTSFMLRIIEQKNEGGPSVARNEGAAAATGPILLFLDADIVVDPELVNIHLECEKKFPNSLICGRLLPYACANITYLDKIIEPDSGLDRGNIEGKLPFYQAFSGNMSLSKDLFFKIGLFDKDFVSFEDVEFGYRASKLGIKIINCPQAIGYHNHSRTLQERCEQARRYNRMIPLLFKKHPELAGTIPMIRDFEAIDWQKENPKQLLNKFRARLYGLSVFRWSAMFILNFINRHQVFPWLGKILYWRLIIGNWYRGFQDGIKLLE